MHAVRSRSDAMANGFDAAMKKTSSGASHDAKLGSRRIFPPQFKLQVLHSYRNDSDCRGNQRATARKYGIHRRQIQKWLQAEPALRGAVTRRSATGVAPAPAATPPSPPSPVSRCASPPPPEPVDLSIRRAPVEERPASPIAWDLSYKPSYPKYGYEVEAPPPPPPPQQPVQQKSFRLFRPYLPEDNFGEVEASPPSTPPVYRTEPVYAELRPATSAFEGVVQHHHLQHHHLPYYVDFRVQTVRAARRAPYRWDCLEAVASAS